MTGHIPLFTSLPPRVKRVARDGQDVGPAWTRLCIDSWRRAGYRVLSVNARAEAQAVRAAYPGIEVVEVDRDGQARTGRPLVYVTDVLALMAGCGHRTAALANADVMFTTLAIAQLPGWQPDGFAFSGRLEVDDLQFGNPRLHCGVDFLVTETRHLVGLVATDFLFGTPWWDLWLPMALAGRGVRGVKLAAKGLPVIAHLAHEERWNRNDMLGNLALFSQALADQGLGLGAVGPAFAAFNAAFPPHDPAAAASDAMLKMCLELSRVTARALHQNTPAFDLSQPTAAAA